MCLLDQGDHAAAATAAAAAAATAATAATAAIRAGHRQAAPVLAHHSVMVESSYEEAPQLFFRPPTLEDLDRIAALEAAGYPPDEAASRERLEYRLKHAGGQFLAAVQPEAAGEAAAGGETNGLRIVGFVCGTLSHADKLTHESMGVHEPQGDLLAIHSVCVDAAHRRRGVATRMLRAYLAYAQGTTPGLREVRLICKEALIPLYSGAGFQMVGPSDVVHGKDPWFEMCWASEGSEGSEDGDEGADDEPTAAAEEQGRGQRP